MTDVLIFGDSIAYGADDIEGGWVQRLRKHFDENWKEDFDYSVYNLGVSGNTTEDLLKRFEFETKQRLKEKKEVIFIFAIGINDSQFLHSKNSLRYTLEEFEKNIKKLIDLSKKYSPKIFFVGLTPVEDSKTSPILWSPDKTYKNEYIRGFDDKIKEICEENNLKYIYMFDKVDESKFEDGLHPDSEGHKKIFEVVKKNLKLE